MSKGLTNTSSSSSSKVEDKGMESYRFDLFKLSQFLFSFGQFYGWKDAGVSCQSTSPTSIERGLIYGYLLECKAQLVDRQGSLETKENFIGLGSRDGLSKTRVKDLLDDVERQLKGRSDDVDIHSLLERFQVWSTKDLAHTLLMPSSCGCHNTEQAIASCWSKLLHMPGAAYTADHLPTRILCHHGMSRLGTEPSVLQEEEFLQKEFLSTTKSYDDAATSSFAGLYHQAHIQPTAHEMCSLSLPPNRYTWKEYARMSEMVSFLPAHARQRASDSLCCGTTEILQSIASSKPTRINAKSALAAVSASSSNSNRIYAPEFHFEAHDLVALWVRAQRSSLPLRHLVQLFSRPNEDELRALGMELGRSIGCTSRDVRCRVVFRGNHSSTKCRVLVEGKLVNALIEWAVSTQALIYGRYMRQQVEADNPVDAGLKRPGAKAFNFVPPSKRARTETVLTNRKARTETTNNKKLLEACYTHLLRWFGQRNLPLLAILFDGGKTEWDAVRMDYSHEALTVFEQCKGANTANAIRTQQRREFQDAEHDRMANRTLAQIDCNIRWGLYSAEDPESYEGRTLPFYLAVNSLLRAGSNALAGEESIHVDPIALQAVLNDFDLIYDTFHHVLCQSGVLAAAFSLLNLPKGGRDANDERGSRFSPELISNLLLDTPSPWHPICSSLLRNIGRGEETMFIVCVGCERVNKCKEGSDFHYGKTMKALQEQAHFSQLFSLQVPDSELVPDFSGVNARNVKWTKLSLVLRREICENGEIEKSGLVLKQTRSARAAFKDLVAGKVKVETLYEGDYHLECPIMIDYAVEGCLVSKVDSGAGRRAGLKRNDVIVGLQYLEIPNGNRRSLSTETYYEFANLSRESRIDLLKEKATAICLTVLRPDRDILAQCSSWLEILRRHNAFVWELKDSMLPLCKTCQQKRHLTEGRTERQRIVREARACRSVIRRLGMQACTLRFHEEEPSHVSNMKEAHINCVSFRRLDAMMAWIILETGGEDVEGVNEKEQLRNAFFLPPWASTVGGRLCWAPPEMEKEPAKLLLTGVGILVRQRRVSTAPLMGQPTSDQDRKALVRHFLHLFSAWCQIPGLAPPLRALRSRAPWLSASCKACQARSMTRSRTGRAVCANDYCWRKMGGSDPLFSYDECAGLVGRTVLVHPNDPWLAYVEHMEYPMKIDSFGRPVEFLVLFFSPIGGGNGEFHLLPVLQQRQLQYLLDRCALLGKPPRKLTHSSLKKWIEGTVFGVKGALRISKDVLVRRLEDTKQFLDEVDEYIKYCAMVNSDPSSTLFPTPSTLLPPSKGERRCWSNAAFSVDKADAEGLLSHATVINNVGLSIRQCCSIVDSLLRLPTPVMERMLDACDNRRDPNSLSASQQDQNALSNEATLKICAWTGRRLASYEKTSLIFSEDEAGNLASLGALTRDGFSIPKPPDGLEFSVIYSDFYFLSKAEESKLESVLSELQLRRPGEIEDILYTVGQNVVLSRQPVFAPNSASYNGVGWGFELLKWKHEQYLRVGRVHPRSPAAQCGLEMHDVVFSLNGREVSEGTTWTHPLICCSILASSVCVSKSRDKLAVMASALSTISATGPILGPVVLRVYRPRKTFDGEPHATVAVNVRQSFPPLACQDDHDSEGIVLCNARGDSSATRNTEALATNRDSPRNEGENVGLLIFPGLPAGSATNHSSPDVAVVAGAEAVPLPTNRSHDSQGGWNHERQSASQLISPEVRQSTSIEEAAIAAISATVPDLSRILAEVSNVRPSLRSRDLYLSVPGMEMVVFTRLETAVLLRAIAEGMAMLGVRLLCPRYSLRILAQQIQQLKVQGRNLSCVPVLPAELWQHLLKEDFTRFEKEPKGARKVLGSFGLPTEKLPIDRSIEEIIREKILVASQKDLNQQLPLQRQQGAELQEWATAGRHSLATWDLQSTSAQLEIPVGGSVLAANARAPFYHVAVPDDTHYGYVRPNNSEHSSFGEGPARIRGGGGSVLIPGDSEDLEKGPIVFTLPLLDWQNVFVSFEAEATQDSVCIGEALFLGRVQLPIDLPDNMSPVDIDTVGVLCFYASSIGVFHEAKTIEMDPEELFLVTPGTRYFALLHHIQTQYGQLTRPCKRSFSKAPAATEPPPEETVNASVDSGENAPRTEIQVSPASQMPVTGELPNGQCSDEAHVYHRSGLEYDKSRDPIEAGGAGLPSRQHGKSKPGKELLHSNSTAAAHIYTHVEDGDEGDAAVKLVRQQLHMKGCLRPMGVLPDGRNVCWFPNDPNALYVASDGQFSECKSQKDLIGWFCCTNTGRPANEEIHPRAQHCCMWGCTMVNNDLDSPLCLVGFTSASDLRSHYEKFHSYGTDKGEWFQLRDGAMMFRVTDGRIVSDLVNGLVSVICALSPSLTALAKAPLRAPVVEDPSCQMIVCSSSRQTLSLSLEDMREAAKSGQISVDDDNKINPIHTFIPLLIKLKLLFVVDEGRPIRLSAAARKGFQEGPEKRQRQETQKGWLRQQLGRLCGCPSPTTLDDVDAWRCSPCAPTTEEVIIARVRMEDEDIQPRRLKRPPVTLHVPTSLGCATSSSAVLPTAGIKNFGGFAFAKQLLLRIADTVPPQLYSNVKRKKERLANLYKVLWKHAREDWKEFVNETSSVDGLSQAFVVLLASVEHDKLPCWWGSMEGCGGWNGNSQRLLFSPSVSSLVLHLLVFDLALAEFVSVAAKEKPLSTVTEEKRLEGLSSKERLQNTTNNASGMSIARFQGTRSLCCLACKHGGTLECCEFCALAVHGDCCDPPVAGNLERWICAACTSDIVDLAIL